jgi:hypothetical protein
MFTTYRTAEIFLHDGQEAAATQLWSFVEQEITYPWFYLQVIRQHQSDAFRTMLMLPHAQDLQRVIREQSSFQWVEQVQLVTPPYVNGRSNWIMEPLEELSLLRHRESGGRDFLYRVSSGEGYTMHGPKSLDFFEVVEILFSSEDLRFVSRSE